MEQEVLDTHILSSDIALACPSVISDWSSISLIMLAVKSMCVLQDCLVLSRNFGRRLISTHGLLGSEETEIRRVRRVRHMNFLSSARCRVLFIRQLRGHAHRCESTLGGPETVDVSFKRLGVPASVAATLRAAFPDIQRPTKTQSELIPAILAGKDVLLRDRTGTGKYVFVS